MKYLMKISFHHTTNSPLWVGEVCAAKKADKFSNLSMTEIQGTDGMCRQGTNRTGGQNGILSGPNSGANNAIV